MQGEGGSLLQEEVLFKGFKAKYVMEKDLKEDEKLKKYINQLWGEHPDEPQFLPNPKNRNHIHPYRQYIGPYLSCVTNVKKAVSHVSNGVKKALIIGYELESVYERSGDICKGFIATSHAVLKVAGKLYDITEFREGDDRDKRFFVPSQQLQERYDKEGEAFFVAYCGTQNLSEAIEKALKARKLRTTGLV
jgi:hypothetical protein